MTRRKPDFSQYRNRPAVTAPIDHRQYMATPTTPASSPSVESRWADLVGLKTTNAKPSTMLDHALRWAERGLHIYPCEKFLGTALVTSPYSAASADKKKIVDWWSETPDADIGCIPSLSDFYVVACFRDEGGSDGIGKLERELGGAPPHEFLTCDSWGDMYIWCKGHAFTSHHKLAPGIHVVGEGLSVFLPPSWAPHVIYREDK